MKKGFSLIELSIVMIIIGLLIGAVTASRHIINLAEINSVVKDINKYRTAIYNFKLVYQQLPGDFNNASSYFSGVSNGNNNGEIRWGSIGSDDESSDAWIHLQKANIIQPELILDELGYTVATSDYSDRTVIYLYHEDGIWEKPGNTITFWDYRGDDEYYVFTPEDARAIDIKIDDGHASKGLLRASGQWEHTTLDDLCLDRTDGIYRSGAEGSATYNLSDKTESCALYFIFDDAS